MSDRGDNLGDRMKLYEMAESGRRFMPLLPIIARVDGRCFSGFTNGMQRPYDPTLTRMMVDTTRHLIEESNACMGYTQSDEITLAWHSTNFKSEVWFGGRILKMASQLAAQATLFFYRLCQQQMPIYSQRYPTFDARLWQVPNRTEGANVFLWREWDATKNSITMAASEYYSHAQLHEKSGAEKQDMLHEKGVNWNDYPAEFKRGTFLQRRTLLTPFTAEELDALPPKHHARTNPGLTIERHCILVLDMPIFGTILNREAVVFDGADPSGS